MIVVARNSFYDVVSEVMDFLGVVKENHNGIDNIFFSDQTIDKSGYDEYWDLSLINERSIGQPTIKRNIKGRQLEVIYENDFYYTGSIAYIGTDEGRPSLLFNSMDMYEARDIMTKHGLYINNVVNNRFEEEIQGRGVVVRYVCDFTCSYYYSGRMYDVDKVEKIKTNVREGKIDNE